MKLNVHSVETFGTHDGPGIRLVIFSQGCNFQCAYCHNPDSQAMESPDAEQMETDEIIERLEKEKDYFNRGGGLTISGGEPTLQAEVLIELFKKAQERGFHTTLDTNGSVVSDTVDELYKVTDLVMLDVKHIDEEKHQKLVRASNKNVLENARRREESGKEMWLRYVLVPGWSDAEEDLERWGQHFADYKHISKVEILPYHCLGVYKYEALGREYRLEGVKPPSLEVREKTKAIFSKYLSNVVIR